MSFQRSKILLYALTGIFCCLLPTGCGYVKPDSAGVQKNLLAALPLHSTRAQVLQYLDQQKFGHSPYRSDPESGNRIEATFSVKTPHALVNPTYDLVFRFDGQERLIACDVQYLGYVGL